MDMTVKYDVVLSQKGSCLSGSARLAFSVSLFFYRRFFSRHPGRGSPPAWSTNLHIGRLLTPERKDRDVRWFVYAVPHWAFLGMALPAPMHVRGKLQCKLDGRKRPQSKTYGSVTLYM